VSCFFDSQCRWVAVDLGTHCNVGLTRECCLLASNFKWQATNKTLHTAGSLYREHRPIEHSVLTWHHVVKTRKHSHTYYMNDVGFPVVLNFLNNWVSHQI